MMRHKSAIAWLAALGFLAAAAPAAIPGAQAADFRAIVAEHSGKCLEVANGGQGDNTPITQRQCNGSNEQAFDLRPVGGGYFNIVAKHSARCLDVPNGNTRDNVPVNQFQCDGSNEQQFSIQQKGIGSYFIAARHSSKCLDIANADPRDNVPVIQYQCNGAPNQAFELRRATAQQSPYQPPPQAVPYPVPQQAAPYPIPQPGVQAARCMAVLATDETRYNFGVQHSPMALQICEVRRNNYRLAIFYGAPSSNGQPTGKLFFQSPINVNSQSLRGPVTDYGVSDATTCGPITYNVIADDNNDPSGNTVRVWGPMPRRDRNCMPSGQTFNVTRVFHVHLPNNAGGGFGGQPAFGAQSGSVNAWAQFGTFLGCLASPSTPGC